MPASPLTPVPFADVVVGPGFWGQRLEVNRRATIPTIHRQLLETGRLDALNLDWREGRPHKPQLFWDSDVAKWLEAACYAQVTHPDADNAARLEDTVERFAKAQQPDGYLNSYLTAVEPDKRWQNLRDWHELYCAGHLIEAAVAHHQATGNQRLLQVACRYADYIGNVFGPGDGQKRGYPGHEEIELAFLKLFRATGNASYLAQSRFFIDERGRQPHYFDLESEARGETPGVMRYGGSYAYTQAHRPVREQDVVVGHAVRAMYLYSAMADLAGETGDESLLHACERLFDNLVAKRLYITGGIGSTATNEGFTRDYDLPNEEAYAETCAAIGLIFWTHRMLQLTGNGKYADLMERCLYNGAVSGVSMDGERFFYVNPLAAARQAALEVPGNTPEDMPERLQPDRKPFFGCACCPPNIARLIASLGGYVYSQSAEDAVVHLYVESECRLQVAAGQATIRQRGNYPWDGRVQIEVEPDQTREFGLRLRLPGWCRDFDLRVNGDAVTVEPELGYLRIVRTWSAGDEVELDLQMPVERAYSHPQVQANWGRVALTRGPLVYCLEGIDNCDPVDLLALPREAELSAAFEPDLLGGVTTISATGVRLASAGAAPLYGSAAPSSTPAALKAVPYCCWGNRAPGDMRVWLRET